MFSKEDMTHIPTKYEMSHYINNKLWDKFCIFVKKEYNVTLKFEFSKCSWEYGWNVKLRKGSQSLCTVYPRENYFCIMVVIGKKEKNFFELILPSLCSDIQEIYKTTKEGNGQKWLMIDLEDEDQKYEDVKKILNIKAQ